MMGPKPKPVSERFWKYVDKSGGDDSCWIWTGHKQNKGYGVLHLNRSPRYAHRISYELHNPNLITDQFVMHKCDNPACVNPKHLILGSQSDNMRDCYKKNRHPNVKITYDQANEIRELYKNESISYEAIGKRYGVTGRTINYIVNEGRRAQ